ncbi:hypothetical protein KEM52_005121 [Ascosphaera acerosa]|nr:hypothetical protein KEM52_005121 [Ascosphaera acerosa]
MYADFGLEYFLERLEFRHVQVGLLGLLLTATLWLTAASRKNLLTGLRGRVSKHMYCLTHLGAVMLLLAAMYFHVKQAKVYALQTLAVYGIDFVSIFSARRPSESRRGARKHEKQHRGESSEEQTA